MRHRLLAGIASAVADAAAAHASSNGATSYSTSSQPWQYSHSHTHTHPSCSSGGGFDPATDDAAAAQRWAIAGLVAILIGGSTGVALPPLWASAGDGGVKATAFALCRAFAAGVVLATGLVHMLPASMRALSDPCLGWPDFPWASVLATAAALLTNAVEFAAGQYFSADGELSGEERASARTHACGTLPGAGSTTVQQFGSAPLPGPNGSTEPLMLGSSSEAAYLLDGLDTTPGQQQGLGGSRKPLGACASLSRARSGQMLQAEAEAGNYSGGGNTGWANARRVATAQVLELGIALHSVLIGVALGVSDSTTAPALASALVFHQSFEGFALGSALADAGIEGWALASRGAAFAVTTPAGVVLGLAIRRSYSQHSPTALIVNGVFNGTSAGILLYMALVDLIAIDFFSSRMRAASPMTQLASYVALFSGAAAMSLLAIWA